MVEAGRLLVGEGFLSGSGLSIGGECCAVFGYVAESLMSFVRPHYYGGDEVSYILNDSDIRY